MADEDPKAKQEEPKRIIGVYDQFSQKPQLFVIAGTVALLGVMYATIKEFREFISKSIDAVKQEWHHPKQTQQALKSKFQIAQNENADLKTVMDESQIKNPDSETVWFDVITASKTGRGAGKF